MKTLKWIGRTLFLDSFAVRLCLMVTLLFTAVPAVQAVVGPYVKILLAWGMAVLGCDMFTRRRALRHRYAGFLALFVLSYTVSILLNRAAGLVGNLSELAYIVLFFFVLFAYDPDGSPERVVWEVRTLSRAFVIVSALLALLCMATFFFSFNYNYSDFSAGDQPVWVVFGVLDSRLYGLYNPNTGSALNLLSSMFSLLLLVTGARRGERIAHGLNLLLQYLCMVLTGSRTAWYMYVVFVVLFVVFALPRRENAPRQWLRELLRAGGAVAAAALILLLSTPVRGVLAGLPDAVGVTISESTLVRMQQYLPLTPNRSPEGDDSSDSGTPNATTSITDRTDTDSEGGMLSGRQHLWKGGWQVFLRQPLFGATHKGLYQATAPFVPEEWHKYVATGGLHNMAFMVLACSGGVGFAVLLCFLLFSGARALKWMWRRRGDRSAVMCNGLTVMLLTILGTEMLESRLLYMVTIFGMVFWTLYGYTMRLVDACEPEKAARGGVYNRLVRRLSEERQNGEKHS